MECNGSNKGLRKHKKKKKILRKNEKETDKNKIEEKKRTLDSLYKRRYHSLIKKESHGIFTGDSGAGKGETRWGKSG